MTIIYHHIGQVITIFFIRIGDQFELIADSILRIFDEIHTLNCDALVDPIPPNTSTTSIAAAAMDAAALNTNPRPVAAATNHRWGLLPRKWREGGKRREWGKRREGEGRDAACFGANNARGRGKG